MDAVKHTKAEQTAKAKLSLRSENSPWHPHFIKSLRFSLDNL